MPQLNHTFRVVTDAQQMLCGCRRSQTSNPFGGPSPEPQYPPHLELEPVHLKIELQFDLKAESVAGQVTTTVVANRAGATSLTLNAIDFLDLQLPASNPSELDFSYDGSVIDLRWKKPFAKDERRDIVISYRVESPISGLFFMQPNAAYPNKPLYAATDHETERARYWLPCLDLPSVRTSIDFHLTAAKELTILANGSLIKETINSEGTKTAHWQLKQRCPSYLTCIAIGDFVRHDDGEFAGIPVAYFTSREFTAADLERSFGRTKDMLAWMTQKLDFNFPYPKYFQFALPQFGGAMENISLVSWSDQFILNEALAPEWTWLVDQVNIHEMAHSYFGDLVVCRDFAHAWLKESWATYMETCWLEDKRGEAEQHYDLHRNANAYILEADERYARPLVTREFTSSWQMYDRHLYPGGACRLHTLRKEIGDDIFWEAVRDYLKTYQFQTVETDDFRRVLEKHSGRSLQKFFDLWIFSPFYPAFKVNFTYDKEKLCGTFEIIQQQAEAAKKGPVFDVSTDLGWTIDGQDHLQAIRLSKVRQSFTIAMAKEPEQVRFDPRWLVLHKLDFHPGDDKLRRQLTQAKDIGGRIHAAVLLGKSNKRANVQAILDAYPTEAFWGVRREMLKALEDSMSEAGLVGLIAICDYEADPLVQDRLFEALGSYRDGRVVQAIKTRLERADLGPLAISAAYQALGKQHQQAPQNLLRAAAEKPVTDHGFTQATALFALGQTRDDRLLPYLMNSLEHGNLSYRIRRGAVMGLSALAPFTDKSQQKQIEEKLVDMLRDPEPWLRLIAAAGLKDAQCKDSVAPLSTFKKTLPLQDQVMVDDFIKVLQRPENARVVSMEKRLDEMQQRLSKAIDRLSDLEDKNKMH